jgi:hypothetical protein
MPDSSELIDGRHETTLERLDRNMSELVAELRVVQTGVQVLFAFLLVVPFNQGFTRVTGFERGTYFVTLIMAALATACLIAPSAQHRFLFRLEDKEHLVFVSNRLAIAGLAALSVAMVGALLLVSTKLFGMGIGLLTLGLIAVPFSVLWFAMPLARRRAVLTGRAKRSSPAPGGPQRPGGDRPDAASGGRRARRPRDD